LLTTDRAVRPRLLSVYGGQLTTWRAVSARALANDLSFAPARRRPRARTDQLKLRPD